MIKILISIKFEEIRKKILRGYIQNIYKIYRNTIHLRKNTPEKLVSIFNASNRMIFERLGGSSWVAVAVAGWLWLGGCGWVAMAGWLRLGGCGWVAVAG